MLAQDVITTSRELLNDPSSQGRWSDSTLIDWLNTAQQEVIRDAEFPESRLVATTVANQQEYSLPELILIYRVYLNGQLIVPTTLQTLEGHQTQDYDQGMYGGTQGSLPPTGGGGPPGGTGMYMPAWTTQQPSTYPVSNSWSSPSPDAQMWFAGERPRYYLRGGSIGIVPAPAGVYYLTIECLRVPNLVVNLTDQLVFPTTLKRALAWKICEYAKFSDDGDRAAEQRNFAAQRYEAQIRKFRTDRKRYDGDQPRMPKFRTYRRGYQKGNNRQGSGGFEYP